MIGYTIIGSAPVGAPGSTGFTGDVAEADLYSTAFTSDELTVDLGVSLIDTVLAFDEFSYPGSNTQDVTDTAFALRSAEEAIVRTASLTETAKWSETLTPSSESFPTETAHATETTTQSFVFTIDDTVGEASSEILPDTNLDITESATASESHSAAVVGLMTDSSTATSSAFRLTEHDEVSDASVTEAPQAFDDLVVEELVAADNLVLPQPFALLESQAEADEDFGFAEFIYPPNQVTTLPWGAPSTSKTWVYDPDFGLFNGSMSSSSEAGKVLDLGPVASDQMVSFWYYQARSETLGYYISGVSTKVTLLTPVHEWSKVSLFLPVGKILQLATTAARAVYVCEVVNDDPDVDVSHARASEETVTSVIAVGIGDAVATEEVTGLGTALNTDVVVVDAETMTGALANGTITSGAVAVGEGFIVRAESVEDIASGSEETETTILSAMVAEVATAQSVLTPSAAGLRTVVEAGAASEIAQVDASTVMLSQGAAFEETEADTDASVVEVVAVFNDLAPTTVTAATIADASAAEDDMLTDVVSNIIVDSVANGVEFLISPNPSQTAWVMNSETGAVSWYSNWGFTHIVTAASGKVYGITPDGLYLLGGNTDAGAPINAHAEFDRTDFGGFDRTGAVTPDEQKKRLLGVSLGYRGTGELEMTVESFGASPGTYTYPVKARADTEHHNGRVVPGKGMISRFWKLKLGNKAGSNFEVVSMSADVSSSQRKV